MPINSSTNINQGYRLMMRLTGLLAIVLFTLSATTHAQQRYDQLTYPELNEFKRPDIETFTLDNGIQFFLVEDRELPLIDVTVRIRTGGVLVPNEKAGLASLTGTVMRSGGTKSYPADTLNQLLENRAASMETGIGFTAGSASMNVLKEDFETLLPVFIDLMTNPAFPEDKIELAKKQMKSSISRRNDNQQQIGYREFEQLIYGEQSVYGRLTEYQTVNNISREDIINFHKDHFVGKNMMVGLVGDFSADKIKKQLQQAFGRIPAGTKTDLEFPEVDYEYKSTINFIDKPDVNQSFVLMGHIGGMRDNPDYPKIQVMNEVLSGGFSGRLFQVVRTDSGLAYSVFGSYGSGSFYPGQFYTGVMTKSSTTAKAIDAIIEQVERLQNEPINEQELKDVKDQFLNSIVFRYDSYEKVLGERISNVYRGLPDDAFDRFIEGVRATTIRDVRDVAQKYLHPDKLQILVVGNKTEIGDQLQKYGNVNEIDITIPQPGDDDQQEVSGDAARGKELLNKMADALISPETELNRLSVQSEVIQYSEQLPGGKMSMQMTTTIDYPDAVERVIDSPQGKLTLILKNGQGTMKMMGQERPLPPQQTNSLKEALNRNYLSVALNNGNLNPQYLGMEEFQDRKYAKLQVTVNDKNMLYLVDESTGLPRLVRYKQFNPQVGKQVTVEERYAEWKSGEGVTFAYYEITYIDGEKRGEITYEEHKVNE